MKNSIKNTYTLKEQQWNQWLFGLIDGDGYLKIQKNNVAVCEITMPIDDEPLLEKVKYILRGNIRLRNAYNAVRYLLGNKVEIKNLINRINGHIRNNIRISQLKKVCNNLNIKWIPASFFVK